MRISDHYSEKNTPQKSPVPGRNMVKNDAGAYAFKHEDFDTMKRFVMIGTEGGTYYASEKTVTVETATATRRAVQNRHRDVVDYLVEVTTQGRVYKLDAALFTFAMTCSVGTDDERSYAMAKIPVVLRTGTQLFKFLQYVKTFRGIGGSGLQRAVSRWFTGKSVSDIEHQFMKYFSREGMSFRDVLRIARPGVARKGRDGFNYENDQDTRYARALIAWAVAGGDKKMTYVNIAKRGEEEDAQRLPPRLAAANSLHDPEIPVGTKLSYIRDYKLPREALPTEALNDPVVWEAMLPHMPMMAMVRNLATMTRNGTLGFGKSAEQLVLDKLRNETAISKSQIHPFHLLMAARTYASGRGMRGTNTWQPRPNVVEALSDAFDISIGAYKGNRITDPTLLAIDTSGSMGGVWHSSNGMSPAEIAAIMTYVFVRMDANVEVIAFDTAIRQYPTITKRTTIDEVVRKASSGGGTDCSLPFRYLEQTDTRFDNVVMVTDSESWAGGRHTFQACDSYRAKRNPEFKAVEMQVAASATGTKQLPTDRRNLQVVGFDAAAYDIVESFLTGSLE